MQKELRIKIWNAKDLPVDWFKRQKADERATIELENSVRTIINQVKVNGDKALIEFASKFDNAKLAPKTLKVSAEEIKEAYGEVADAQIAALRFIKEKVEALQKQQLTQIDIRTESEGTIVRTILLPIESVGCYVPGGQAAYPSTLVMTVVPAKIAKVRRVVVCSPSNSDGKVNPLVLVASDICGVDELYKVGGAQAVAALAYGTETINPVCKIVGPGSRFVTAAKSLVSMDVAIDMPAGPSEVLVLADESADARLIAFDMISQAEHGGDSVVGLITTSDRVAKAVVENLSKLVALAERGEKVYEALAEYGFIIICESISQAVTLANQFAPEHLEVMAANARELTEKLTAGLILVGPHSPVALSDYGSGTNHVLPTGGFAKSLSGLSALDFVRRVSIIESSKAGLEKVKGSIKVLTEAENLPNHYRAIEARFEE
jgi:histidinol dehydrogenase